MSTELRLNVSCEGDAICLMVSGEVDLLTGSELCDSVTFAAEQASRVLVDLSEVSFIDSSGVAALLLAQRRARGHGSQVVVTAASHEVATVLRLADVAHHLGFRSNGATAG